MLFRVLLGRVYRNEEPLFTLSRVLLDGVDVLLLLLVVLKSLKRLLVVLVPDELLD